MSEWISVEERLPEPEVDVLAWVRDHAVVSRVWTNFLKQPYWHCDRHGSTAHVTHWMPLPAPPAQTPIDLSGLTWPDPGPITVDEVRIGPADEDE